MTNRAALFYSAHAQESDVGTSLMSHHNRASPSGCSGCCYATTGSSHHSGNSSSGTVAIIHQHQQHHLHPQQYRQKPTSMLPPPRGPPPPPPLIDFTQLMGSKGDYRQPHAHQYSTCGSGIVKQAGEQLGKRPSSAASKKRRLRPLTRALLAILALSLLAFIAAGLYLFAFRASSGDALDPTTNNAYSQQMLYGEAQVGQMKSQLPARIQLGERVAADLPPRRIIYTQLHLVEDSHVLFNISTAASSKLVLYGRQTLHPTPASFDFQRIISADHLHLRGGGEMNNRYALPTQYLSSGQWFLGLLNDAQEVQSISIDAQLFPVTRPASGCAYDCFGKGHCKEDVCQCHPGYGGRFCEELACPLICSGSGVFSEGRCICHEGFSGNECQLKEAAVRGNATLAAIRDVSSGGGASSLEEEEVASGEVEAVCVPGCGEHGRCSINSNNAQLPKCECSVGWGGDACQVEECGPSSGCNGGGVCVTSANASRPGWTCHCDGVHHGPLCQYAKELECGDGIDNDGDGLVDCADSFECCSSPACSSSTMCMSVPEPKVREANATATDFFDSIGFLFGGEEAVQRYAEQSKFVRSQVALIRGRLLSKRGGPLIGVRISEADNAQHGFTISRSGSNNGGDIGRFDLAVNGGSGGDGDDSGTIQLLFIRQPFGRVTRSFHVPPNRIVDVGDVVMDGEGR